ncbi:MAG: glutamine--fructose-6-phosphate transaminase (isomerizing) [Desulfovibrionaceae bacterium]|nr:glutamine--fructose-6-phosphate transaminase (isomerizing) [Desulfovibrionaceae bacterium]
MCGIIGYAGRRDAIPCIVEGLRRLEYRGYDSAGVAYIDTGEIVTVRAEGKLHALDEKLAAMPKIQANTGIGHTRWATHGVPAERNAHPHRSCDNRIVIVHNGIIENFEELKVNLKNKGYTFASETDTEVLANLIAEGLRHTESSLEAFAWALRQANGAYAVAMLSLDEPDVIYAARLFAPLLLGVGQGENFVASDIPAFLPYTRDVVFLDDGEIARIDGESWQVLRLADLTPVHKEAATIEWDMQAAQKDGYPHFMLKEIFEQPKVIFDCLTGALPSGRSRKNLSIQLPELDDLPIPERLHIVACGSSFHAGLWGQYLFESWARMPVSVEIASEFRYRDVILDKNSVVLAISQSGETADTLAGMELAKSLGATVLGLCNVVGSSVAREADRVIFTQAGPEISVASTKAVCSQMVCLALMALYWGQKKGVLSEQQLKDAVRALRNLPTKVDLALPTMRNRAIALARRYHKTRRAFFIGRGHCYPMAMEGALKLKELAYISAEGYAAGEMKHGPIALVDPELITFALALDDALFPKVKSNIEEMQARRGKVVAITNAKTEIKAEQIWRLPASYGPLGAFLVLPALQLVSYEIAVALGCDVDQPRNLAKSVTVE